MDGSQTTLGFGTVADGRWLVAKLTACWKVMAELAPDQQRRVRGLGVSVLHKLVSGPHTPRQDRRHAGVQVRPPS